MPYPLLKVEKLKKYFPVEKGLFSKSKDVVHAVDGISFSIRSQETFSLIGETGCGKTTTGKLILRLIEPTEGKIFFEGIDILSLNKKEMQKMRCDMQMVFQDPFASLNPRIKIGDSVGLPLDVYGIPNELNKTEIIMETLEKVGLTPAEKFVNRLPHELSGGQKQRVVVARTLISNPKFIVADEPVSSLDLSIRSQILNMMLDLKNEFKLTYLLIAHDLSIVRYMSDWIAVMYLGKILEMAPSEDLFNSPLHPYTKALVAAVPIPDPTVQKKKMSLKGEIPSQIHLPIGCRFQSRCPYVNAGCREDEPQLLKIEKDHYISCHRYM